MQRPQSCGRAIGRNRESFVARQDQNATHGRRAVRAPRKTRARQLETKINIVSQSAVMPNEKKPSRPRPAFISASRQTGADTVDSGSKSRDRIFLAVETERKRLQYQDRDRDRDRDKPSRPTRERGQVTSPIYGISYDNLTIILR